MGNRHHDKKTRRAVRAAMAKTGESYQKVLCRLRSESARALALAPDVDLVPIQYFGVPMTLATFELLGALSCLVMPANRQLPPFPKSPLFALARTHHLS